MDDQDLDISVLETDSDTELQACSLVLTAVAVTHTVHPGSRGGSISVAAKDELRARHHLDAYLHENRDWPPRTLAAVEAGGSAQPPTLLVIGGLIVFYAVTGPWTPHSGWFADGAGDAAAILQRGEYYRLLTALTLHADLNHLLSNCLFGGFLLHFLLRSVGSGVGLTAMLFAAGLANYVNVWLRGAPHLFVGFSTAVFAIIGMLAVLNAHSRRRGSRLQVAVPFMAGAALLAMTGSSGVRTDLGAHLFGLLSGMAAGAVLIIPACIGWRSSGFLQFLLFWFAIATVLLCWNLALQEVY